MKYNIKKFTSNSGFTLIELLIYITLVAGVLIMATSFAWNVINSRNKAFAVQAVEENGRFITEKIIQAAQAATDINATGSTLSLQTKDGALDPTVFTLTNAVLRLQQGSGTAYDLSSDQVRVTSFIVKNESTANNKAKNIRVSLTIEHYNPANRQEWAFTDSFETTIELRDK